ncbi:MAG: isochorismatase family protein [Candidatus Binataceae bacterium]
MANERIWDRFITERDKRIFVTAGFGQKAGWGKNPALIIIDVTYAFAGEGEPIEESLKRYPLSCGAESWTAIKYNQQLLKAARQAGIPVFYTLTEYRSDSGDVGGWAAKDSNAAHSSMLEGDKGGQIVEELRPAAGEIVISKKKPSAFFGTPIVSYLIDRRIDTVIITGCTTSGCVRSSVIDAFSYNYRIIVPEECAFDRGQASHAINLFDVHQKYADVISTGEVIEHLASNFTHSEAHAAAR